MRRMKMFQFLTPFLLPLVTGGGCMGLGGCIAEGGGWTIEVGSPFKVEWRQHPDANGEYRNRVSFDPEGAGIVHAFMGDKTPGKENAAGMPVVIIGEGEMLGDGGSPSDSNGIQ